MNWLHPMTENSRSTRFSSLVRPHFWLGVVISLLALYLSARDVRWPEVVATLSQAHALLVALALASVLLNTWAKASRWKLLFYPQHSRLSVLNCLFALLIGQLANSLLPARLGELTRAYVVGEGGKIDRVFAFTTTLVEKAMDSVMLLMLIAAVSLFMPMPSWLRYSSLTVSAALVVFLLAVTILGSRQGRVATALEGWRDAGSKLAFLRVLERLVRATQELRALRHPNVQLRLWAWSVLIWMLAVATNVLTLRAVNLEVSPLLPLILLVVLMAGAVLPASPMRLGVFHYSCVLTLSLFRVEPDAALSYAVLLHLIIFVPIVVGAVLGLWVRNYDLGKLVAASGQGEVHQ
jgi:uncharacterized protein (TIRG00374 family)